MSPSTSLAKDSSKAENLPNKFKAFKAVCVPLLANSLLTPESISRVSALLSQLRSLLKTTSYPADTLSPSTISYIFYPLSHILQRNASSSIPDVIMEKLMDVIGALFEHWWWTCPVDVWEQILMLSAAIISSVDSGADPKGKGKEKDDETKRAAAQCLWTVLRRRSEAETASIQGFHSTSEVDQRFTGFQTRGRAPKLLPVLGQTLTSLLEASQSPHRGLQDLSLQIIYALINDYLPEAFIPSILPGVVSTMAKVALGLREGKGWSNGLTVDRALAVIQVTIIAAVGDEICKAEGALRTVLSLEDLNDILETGRQSNTGASQSPLASSFFTRRTSVWLAASASQLHMVLNTLPSLLSHPNPLVLLSLSRFSHALLSSTHQTLPDTQPLLLSFLLSLSTSQFPEVVNSSNDHLLTLLAPPSVARFTLLQILMRSAHDNLTSLPRLLPSHNDAKVEHLARQISAVCRLSVSVHAVSDGIGTLLGPSGGIEKWGWSLLSVLQLAVPPLFVSTIQPQQTLLEGSASSHPFPDVDMKHVSNSATREALDDMFRALGAAAGTECLFAVEWFVSVARRGRGTREVAALWCAGRILEGLCQVTLDRTNDFKHSIPRRVEKVARWTAKVIAELWDQDEDDEVSASNEGPYMFENEDILPLEYVKGLHPLITRFDLNNYDKPSPSLSQSQDILHRVLSLQLLSITSAILQSRFLPLLLHALYPVLHSLVSENSYESSTASAALHYISYTTAYASPSNMLLANFDYVLDNVARRLDRRRLRPEATKTFVVLVRLVGKDIVSRAGDVVEACFDRLDEFHGYGILVEGLIEVLSEVVKAVEANTEAGEDDTHDEARLNTLAPKDHVQTFLDWYSLRHDSIEEDQEDYGPAPRDAWANLAGKGKEVVEDEQPASQNAANVQNEPPLTPIQALTQQIISRSIYFLTHPSPLIRTRILDLLATACPTLSASTLLPSIHSAWPYILNRMEDSEPYVVSAAVSLIASLAEYVGEFMTIRIWNDVWPRFRAMLSKLEQADSHSALARRGHGTVGTESAYTHSHRIYKALLCTMRAVVKGVQLRSDILWELSIAFRRFFHIEAHEELQRCARETYAALMKENADVVWLALFASTKGDVMSEANADWGPVAFLKEGRWDIKENTRLILNFNSA